MSAEPPRVPAPTWLVGAGLLVVYLVWGSTYLAIRVMVETVPPLLAAGTRFSAAGLILLGAVTAVRGPRAIAIDRRMTISALAIGFAMTGSNAIITLAEVEVPSALAALLVATVPLWVVIGRRISGERVPVATVAAVAIGFVGVSFLLRPGEHSAGASSLALGAVLLGAVMWATGSVASSRVLLPANPFSAAGWQMALGGAIWVGIGVMAGETSGLDPAEWSTASIAAFAYLLGFGSLLAFTVYAWLLQNAPVSKVATYAYVNPVVAIALGWLVLGEAITATTLIAAAIIVASVVLVIRDANSPGRTRAATGARAPSWRSVEDRA